MVANTCPESTVAKSATVRDANRPEVLGTTATGAFVAVTDTDPVMTSGYRNKKVTPTKTKNKPTMRLIPQRIIQRGT
ncbi:MAG TPA: hypothetical protein DCP28_01430 [Cytophagales bacterium]|nr:hypothetical protein [Cytophagales bacterium]